MAAPKGNKFWQRRSTHGREAIFKDPKVLRAQCMEYFKWADDNPEFKTEAKVVSTGNNQGSKVEMINVPIKRPYLLGELCLFLHVNTEFWREFRKRMKNNKDFSSVIKEVDDICVHQNLSGAATGHYNSMIIARHLGLKERVDQTSDDAPINKELSDEELNDKLEKLLAKAGKGTKAKRTVKKRKG